MLPIAVKAGIDPVYFGLMFVLNGAIGLITPPVGMNVFVLRSVLPETPEDIAGMRFGLLWVAMISTLANRQRLKVAKDDEPAVSRTLPVLFVSNLIDMLCGAAAASMSADTEAELRELRSTASRQSA